jgi:DNA polymerase
MNVVLLQLLQSWQRAGVRDLPLAQPEAVAKMLAEVPKYAVAQKYAATTPLDQIQGHSFVVQQVNTRAGLGSETFPQSPFAGLPVTAAEEFSRKRDQPKEIITEQSKPTGKQFEQVPYSLPSSQVARQTLPIAEQIAALEIIRAEVAACTRCAHLAAERHHTVFGMGDPAARLCFVGEAPGAEEDATGQPFVGRAGQLLTKMIEACHLTREQVYIANVLKCRPPDNRPPEPPEVANCRGYLDRQLAILRPELIVCLGATAAKCLLNTQVSIGRLRGRWHDYTGIPVYCTYHPSYLLRNPASKKDVWEDLKVVMARLGVTL